MPPGVICLEGGGNSGEFGLAGKSGFTFLSLRKFLSLAAVSSCLRNFFGKGHTSCARTNGTSVALRATSLPPLCY